MGSNPDSAARPNAIEKARSGRLLVREADGAIRPLVDATLPAAQPWTPVDAMDPSVAWDGSRIVFTGFSPVEQAWRIFEVAADGSGLRQVTRSDRVLDLSRFGAAAEVLRAYDDVDPCYLPDGRICFVSTRYPEVAPDGRQRATNLYVVNPNGADLHRITSERFGADTPAVDPQSGMLVYSRWWRSSIFALDSSGEPGQTGDPPVEPGSPGYGGVVPEPPVDGQPVEPIRAEITDKEFPGLNNWFLASINPDGSGMSMLSGMGLDRQGTQAWRPSFEPDGTLTALFIPRTPFLGLPRGDGLRVLPRGPGQPVPIGGPQTFAGGEKIELLYASAEPLPDGRLLISAARPSAPQDYDLYIQPLAASSPVLFHRAPSTAELGAVALVPRARPPVIADGGIARLSEQPPRNVAEAFTFGGHFTFLAENIFGNGPVGMPIASAPPAVADLAIEFFMNPQRTGTTEPDDPILVTSRHIDPSGRIEVELPAGVPLFEVLRTPSGRIPIGRDGQIFHVGGHNFGTPGKTARCIGCHVGHSMLEMPADPAWTNLAPSAGVTASSSRLIPVDPTVIDAAGNNSRALQRPENLVDRKTNGPRTEWAAAADALSASLEMRWQLPIRARAVVLYGTAPGPGTLGERNQTIRAVTLVTLLGAERRTEQVVSVALSPAGTHVALDTARPFNRLQVIIRHEDVDGLYEGKPSPALAEIEVIARVAESDGALPYIRGDANSDGQLQISDPMRILNFLFQGGSSVPCAAAADANGSGKVDMSDAVHVLNFLFLGGEAPSYPFPECGFGSGSPLSCDGPTACR
jgi:hypothetical protein